MPPPDLSTLSAHYGLATSEVWIDARLVERWQAPQPELVGELSRRHRWPPAWAGAYLADLHGVLDRPAP